MKNLIVFLVVLLLFTNCDKKKEVVETIIEQPIQKAPFEDLKKSFNYDNEEDYFQTQMKIHYAYALTPQGKADPEELKKTYEELVTKAKNRYSLTEQQVNMIRNKKLYIGMHRSCVYLALGEQYDILSSPKETKTVTADGVTHILVFKPSSYRTITAITLDDVLVSFQE